MQIGAFARTQLMRRRIWSFSALLFLTGCNDKPDTPQIIPLDGKVEKVEISGPDGGGKITVTYFSDKQKQEMTGTAFLTRETEVLINGAAGTLKDIRPGERVSGEVRVEKKKGERVQTVLKIRLDRPRSESTTGG